MKNRARTTTLIALGLAVAFALAGPALAQGNHDNDRGTIKVHDDLDAQPDQRNEPHVSCDFWVQGFNMRDMTGSLKFIAWPPTGDKTVVTPTGDSLTWTGTPDGDGEWNFLKGAYQLPAGHYRVEAYTDDGHPGNQSHFAKAKMFWVDPCEVTPPTPPSPPTPPTQPPTQPPTTPPGGETPEVPFFTGPASLVLAALGAAGSVAFVVRRGA